MKLTSFILISSLWAANAMITRIIMNESCCESRMRLWVCTAILHVSIVCSTTPTHSFSNCNKLHLQNAIATRNDVHCFIYTYNFASDSRCSWKVLSTRTPSDLASHIPHFKDEIGHIPFLHRILWNRNEKNDLLNCKNAPTFSHLESWPAVAVVRLAFIFRNLSQVKLKWCSARGVSLVFTHRSCNDTWIQYGDSISDRF